MEGSERLLIHEAPSVDALYEAFCTSLPEHLRQTARALPHKLRLAPGPLVPWSAVFGEAVTLQAPLLLAEALPGVGAPAMHSAASAHLLSVIEAFGADRLADGQIEADSDVLAVIERVRWARDGALAELDGDPAVELARAADADTVESIRTERELLRAGSAVTFDVYESVSSGKQAVGLVATVALARQCNLRGEEVQLVRECLLGVALALQYQDDVVDWEDDASNGGAWAVLLAGAGDAPAFLDELRPRVHASRVMAKMLRAAHGHFQAARAHAEALGAATFAEYCRAKAAVLAEHCAGEERSAGYFFRLRKLSPWAMEVLR